MIGATSNAGVGTGQLAPNAAGGVFLGAPSTEDTTSAKTLVVTVTHSSSSASQSTRTDFAQLVKTQA
jgi:hypothetical protein